MSKRVDNSADKSPVTNSDEDNSIPYMDLLLDGDENGDLVEFSSDEDEIDVETVTTYPKHPLIVLNPSVLTVYDRSSLPVSESEKDTDLIITPTSEDHEFDYNLRQNGNINVLDPTVINPDVLRELNRKLCVMILEIQNLIKNKGKNRLKLEQFFYNYRESFVTLNELRATISSICEQCSFVKKMVHYAEENLNRNLYLVGEDDDDMFDKSDSPCSVRAYKIPPLMHTLKWISSNNVSKSTNERVINYQISLSIKSLGKYLLLLAYFHRIRTSSNYSPWSQCIEAYYTLLVQILTRFRRVISNPLVKSYMKSCLKDYLISWAMKSYLDQTAEVLEDVNKDVPVTVTDWIKLKNSFPPNFFKQEIENLLQLCCINLRKRKLEQTTRV